MNKVIENKSAMSNEKTQKELLKDEILKIVEISLVNQKNEFINLIELQNKKYFKKEQIFKEEIDELKKLLAEQALEINSLKKHSKNIEINLESEMNNDNEKIENKSKNKLDLQKVIVENISEQPKFKQTNLFLNSQMLTIDQQIILSQWFSGNKPYKLLLNAVTEKADSKKFHFHCDDKKKTLIVIKSGNYLAGGFSDNFWSGNGFKYSENSFLFSINRNKKYPIKKKQFAVYCSVNDGPIFGG